MFQHARIKLTLWYVFIIMMISFAFSLVIYQALSRELERFATLQRVRLEQRIYDTLLIQPGVELPDSSEISEYEINLAQNLKQRLILWLAIINSTILVVSGGISYIFAGKTLSPIKEMMEEQNRFISDASHEFRTPLTSLKSAFEVYLRDKKPTLLEAKVTMEDSLIEVDKLQNLSDSLLQLAQYQNPEDHVQMEAVQIKKTVQDAIRKMSPVAQKKQIALESQLIDAKVLGNGFSLTDLWVILIDNAIKYSPEKSIIHVSMSKRKDTLKVVVQDSGDGIAPQDLTHIFDRFYRADQARRKSGVGGYGLGLPIAKKIVTSHNGNIIVKSKLKQGTTITIDLPTSK